MASRILVVDDDSEIRDSFRQILAEESYDVHCAIHGAEAIAVLRRGLSPHLIVLDLMMPVMDGWEFREQQMANPTFAAIPVIVCSAYPTPNVFGPVSYLCKPIGYAELLEGVARALFAASIRRIRASSQPPPLVEAANRRAR
jgi:CheY-like chemotaxis protein